MDNKNSTKSNYKMTHFRIRKINSLKISHKYDQLLTLLNGNFKSLWLDLHTTTIGNNHDPSFHDHLCSKDILRLIFHHNLRSFSVYSSSCIYKTNQFDVYFEAWKMMLAQGVNINNINSGNDNEYVSLWDPQRFDKLVLNFGFFHQDGMRIDLNNGDGNAVFHMLENCDLHSQLKYSKYSQKCTEMKLNPQTVVCRVYSVHGVNLYVFQHIYEIV